MTTGLVLKWYNWWPLAIYIIVFIFNIDYVVIPILMKRGIFLWNFSIDLSNIIPQLSIFGVFWVASFIATIESIYSFWFWGWFGHIFIDFAIKKESVKEGIKIGRQIGSDLKDRGYKDVLKEYIVNLKHVSEDSRFIRWTKKGKIGLLVVFGLSSLPESGIRLLLTIFCRSTGWISGFIALLGGNIVKTAIMVFGLWNVIFNYDIGAYVFVLVFFVMIVFPTYRFFRSAASINKNLD